MADALLSAFLDPLVSAISKMAVHEVELVTGVGDAIENLKKNLGAIKAVLKDAERRQWQDDAVKLWMDELKDISCDMDDVLDEWGTASLKTEIEKEERKNADHENASFVRKIKVRFYALCRCFQSGPLPRMHHRLDIAHKMENLNVRLDSITSRKDTFGFSLTTARTDEPIRSAVTTSLIDVSKVFGQDTYKKDLIDRLLCGGSEEGGELRIIPVVGMGGIGKTTLAKMAYNDDRVKSHFGKRIWICVSDTFDMVMIAGAMIEQLTGRAPRVSGLEALMQNLVESIKDAKFLLVLDDVWTDEYQQWEQLKNPLLCGAIGSRVVVTTRKVEVARMMGVSDHMMIRMEELSKTDCWLLFSEIAFVGNQEAGLEQIGRQIALKCDGLPLAAKTLGSLLRIKRTRKEWLDVLQSEIWRLEKVRENLFYPLLLSYFDLSPVEKRCFLHCALFPKDHEIERDDLIYLWMAQGLFSLQENVEEEAVLAERCFENLAMRSFFQDFDYFWEGYIQTCKMHDIVHDFARFVTSNEYATLVIDNIQEKEKGDLSARHLTILIPSYDGAATPLSISNKKNLQSLMFVGHDIVDNGVAGCCLCFTYLRTLILRIRLEKSIPESIGDLLHLRYLKLSRSRTDANDFRELPKTLGNLCNLQTLILENFLVPKEAAKLINLRNLNFSIDVGLDDDFESLPKGVGRIRNLQMLNAKLCSSAENNVNEKFQLEDLGSLNYLRKLLLQGVGTDQGHVGGATKARLHQKSYLTTLGLLFGEDDHTTHQAVLEALQPPPNLEVLCIHRYSGAAIPPSWMNLKHLKFLHLSYCLNCETLPPLGNLQSLEILIIEDFEKVKKVGPEFLGILEEECNSIMVQQATITLFPKLKKLSFVSMESWCEWVGIPGWNKESTNIRIMPCLEYLVFEDCDQLQALPEFLETAPLKELDVSWSTRLVEEIRNNWAKTKFRHVPIIRLDGHI